MPGRQTLNLPKPSQKNQHATSHQSKLFCIKKYTSSDHASKAARNRQVALIFTFHSGFSCKALFPKHNMSHHRTVICNGDLLIDYRWEPCGLTQKQFAEVAGCSVRTIRKAETGQQVRITSLEAMVAVFQSYGLECTTTDYCNDAVSIAHVRFYKGPPQLCMDTNRALTRKNSFTHPELP